MDFEAFKDRIQRNYGLYRAELAQKPTGAVSQCAPVSYEEVLWLIQKVEERDLFLNAWVEIGRAVNELQKG